MPYDPARDAYSTSSGPSMRAKSWSDPISPSASEFARYPKALTVLVPTGTAGPHLSIVADAGDDVPQPISLPEGLTILDFVVIRAVTAITAGVVVRRLDD
jgi:hypothetical protein